jgi:hypothetical protein
VLLSRRAQGGTNSLCLLWYLAHPNAEQFNEVIHNLLPPPTLMDFKEQSATQLLQFCAT